MMRRILGMIVLAALGLSACKGPTPLPSTPSPEQPSPTPSKRPEVALVPTGTARATEAAMVPEERTLTVMGHDSLDVSEELLAAFEDDYKVEVQLIRSGESESALTEAIRSKENPQADVFYGVDTLLLARAIEADIFEPYASPLLEAIPDQFELDREHRALPVDYIDVCLNYDRYFYQELGIDPPGSLMDLLDTKYKGHLIVENPATSSAGLAFLLITIGQFGEEAYLEFWRGLVENDVQVVADWDEAYFDAYTLYGGTRPILVSYASIPAAEAYFSDELSMEPPSGVLTDEGNCFRQIEFVGILKGTQRRDLAEAWIDFMLSPAFQEEMAQSMLVLPVNQNAQLEDVFARYLVNPEEPTWIPPATIEAQREAWIQAWEGVVLR